MHRRGTFAGIVAALALVAFPAAAAADQAAPLFNPDAVASLHFTLSDDDRAALDAAPETYVPAGLEINSAAGGYAGTVGLRLKGSTSFRTLAGKAAFKVKFKEFGGAKFLGLKKLTLNNLVQDPSMIHEEMAYELFRGAGVPAPRTGYAYIDVNGNDYGLYLNVETLDDVSLPLWFDTTQHLYEGGYGIDARAEDAPYFEPDEGNADDLSDFEALAAAVAGDDGPFSERVGAVADLEEMAMMWAVERYVGHWDGYTGDPDKSYPPDSGDEAPPNNYYLHSDATGLFTLLPWGTDQTFTRDHTVNQPRTDGPERYLIFDAPSALLFEECMADPACRPLYEDALATLPGTVESLGLDAHAASLATQLAPFQADDPRKEYEADDIAAGVAATRAFIASRPADLMDPDYWTGGQVPYTPTTPTDPTGPTGPQPLEELPAPPLDPGPPEGSPAADTTFPQTEFTHVPPPEITTKRRRVSVRFRFRASEPNARFGCRLDDGRWHPCLSPERFQIGPGDHVFRVRATDPAGNTDASPAVYRWAVRSR